jgi:bromodomain-containing factor 1
LTCIHGSFNTFFVFVFTDPRDDQIAELERHLAIVSQQLASMKSSKKRKAERQMSRSNSSKMTKPAVGTKEKSSSKYSRPSKSSGEKRKRPVKSKSEDDLLPEFTFEQKKDLSESINNLDGNQLNTVVQIIQSSMPNLDGVCFAVPSNALKTSYGYCIFTIFSFPLFFF